jgi:hypothetical protein
MNFLIYAKTTAVLMLAKTVEDVIVMVKENTGRELKFWKVADRLKCGPEAKEIRALANTIKHNRNIIRAADSQSSRFW